MRSGGNAHTRRTPFLHRQTAKRRPAHPDALAAAFFLLPSVLGTAVFSVLPLAETMRRSVTNALGTVWMGVENYQSVLQNAGFRMAARNTVRFIGVCLPLLLLVSLVLALLLRRAGRGGALFKTTFLLPMALPVAGIVLLWQALFAQQGLAGGLLDALGAQPVDFMGTGAAFWVLVGTYVWKNAGYDMLLWLCGLDGISASLYEAAAVDGANAWQALRRITLPALVPTAALTAVLSLVNSFKVFREAYLVAGGYPHESMYLLQHLFNNWFLALDLPRLCAAAVLVAAALSGFILLLGRLWRRERD